VAPEAGSSLTASIVQPVYHAALNDSGADFSVSTAAVASTVTRHVPAKVRDKVIIEGNNRCYLIAKTGSRCEETLGYRYDRQRPCKLLCLLASKKRLSFDSNERKKPKLFAGLSFFENPCDRRHRPIEKRFRLMAPFATLWYSLLRARSSVEKGRVSATVLPSCLAL
jgi:hypothetical protein